MNIFASCVAESAFPELWRELAGLWPMSPGPTGLTLRDWSGSKNHGVLTNMDAATDWVVGQRGYALDFAGDDDHIVISPTNDALNFGISDFSASVWFKTTDGTLGYFCEFGDSGAAGAWWTFGVGINVANKLFSQIDDGTNTGFKDGATNVNDGEWHNFIVTFDRDDRITLYLDGKVDGVSAPIGAVGDIDTTADRVIAVRLRSSVAYYDGLLRDFIVYRRLLTHNEIQAIVAGASPLTPRRRGFAFISAVYSGRGIGRGIARGVFR